MSLLEMLAVFHEFTIHVSKIALPVDGNPVEGHAVPASLLVQMVSLNQNVLHSLVLVRCSPILMIVGVSIQAVIRV
jgi:hypothetical protein